MLQLQQLQLMITRHRPLKFNNRRTDGVIFDPWDTLAVHIFGTFCNKILKFFTTGFDLRRLLERPAT